MEPRTTRSHSSFIYAVIGAVAMTVFSWIPFAPVVGGALAGYLESTEPDRTRSASKRAMRVGGIAGALAMIPAVVIAGIILSIVGIAWLGAGASGSGVGAWLGVPIVAGVFGLFVLAMIAVYHVGLGALGGWLGAELVDGDDTEFESASEYAGGDGFGGEDAVGSGESELGRHDRDDDRQYGSPGSRPGDEGTRDRRRIDEPRDDEWGNDDGGEWGSEREDDWGSKRDDSVDPTDRE